MSTILNIDTLASANRLKQAGADDKLAEAIVEVLGSAEATDLATKADLDTGLADVRTEIKSLEVRMTRLTLGSTGVLGLLIVALRLFP